MGEGKAVIDGGIVSVHTIFATHSDGTGEEALDLSRKWARWLRSAGVPDSIVYKLLLTSSRDGQDISYDELRAWGVVILPKG